MSRKRIEKQLAAFLREWSGEPNFPLDTDDLIKALGFETDTLDEFLESYAAQFHVDLTAFLQYFHYDFTDPRTAHQMIPYLLNGQVAPYQPITFANLADAAQTGCWEWEYPPHRLKTVGWKDVLQYILIAAVALWIVASFFL